MLTHFGWKAVIGIVVANVLHFAVFRRRFCPAPLAMRKPQPAVTAVQRCRSRAGRGGSPAVYRLDGARFCINPPLVVMGFLFSLGYVEATERFHQAPIHLVAGRCWSAFSSQPWCCMAAGSSGGSLRLWAVLVTGH